MRRVADLFRFAMECGDNFNLSANVAIEFGQLFRRNPKFSMQLATHDLDWIALYELRLHVEARHIAGPGVTDIPIARYLRSILFVQNWIKDRLPG